MNKQGNFLDWFFIIVALFVTGVVVILSYFMITVVDSTNIFAGNTDAQAAIDSTSTTLLSFDNMMLFILVGLSVFVLVSSAVVWNHPAFFIVGFFLMMIAIVTGAIAANVFSDFTDAGSISTYSDSYPKTLFIMDHLPYYIAFMGAAISLTMYVSYRRQ